MKPPEQFFDEFEPIRERIRWAQAGLGTEKQIAQGKMMLDDFRDFFRKWRPQINGHPEACRLMDTLRGQMDKMERHLHQVFWAHLNEVIEARKEWIQIEAIFQAMVAVITLRKQMPEKLRDGFEKILRDYAKGEFDAEKEYRDSEKDVTEAEAEFRKALAGLEVDWPERVDAGLRNRLEKLEVEGAKAWQAEVAAQMEKLGDRVAAQSA